MAGLGKIHIGFKSLVKGNKREWGYSRTLLNDQPNQMCEVKPRIHLTKDFDTMLSEGFPTIDKIAYDMTLRVTLTPHIASGQPC
ncbi:hypothetical protein L0F63_003581 [Massospora cicadina]|nr:hypothetical protein L0F63_003581 [Massospora cicadina]